MIAKYITTVFCTIPINVLFAEYLPPHEFYINLCVSAIAAMIAWIFTSTFKWENTDANDIHKQ